MEVSEQQRIMRSSKISRLPAPKSSQESGGLVEMTESQNNSRIQSTIQTYGKSSIQGIKRETPQPATQSEPKRKQLAERVGEYPRKTGLTGPAAGTRSNVQGIALVAVSGASGLKPPTTYQPSRQASSTSSTSSSSTNSFNKSIGPPRSNTLDRPKTSRNNARPIHTRSKSQAATRPRTAHGLYEEERHEPPSKTQSTRLLSQSLQTTQQLHNPKTRSEPAATTRLPPITNSRESSLNKWFAGLSLEDRNPSHGGQVIPPASSRHRSEIPCPPTLPQATPRRFVKEKGSSIGNINKLSRPTTTPEP